MHENTCTQQLWRDEELIESMNECHETDRLIGQALPDMLVISLVRSRATILHAHLETKPGRRGRCTSCYHYIRPSFNEIMQGAAFVALRSSNLRLVSMATPCPQSTHRTIRVRVGARTRGSRRGFAFSKTCRQSRSREIRQRQRGHRQNRSVAPGTVASLFALP